MIKHLFALSIFMPLIAVILGYGMTAGFELYYQLHPLPVEDEMLDYTPSNHEISAEISHGHSNYIVLNSNRHIHLNDETRHS